MNKGKETKTMSKQIFTVEITTQDKDGCGNAIPPLSEGEVRKALQNGLKTDGTINVRSERGEGSLLYKAM